MIWSLDKQSNKDSTAADITEDVNNKAVRVFIILCLGREDTLQWFIKMNIWSILTLANGATLQHKYTLDPLTALVTTATYSHLQFWKTVVFVPEQPWHRWILAPNWVLGKVNKRVIESS